MIEKDLDNPNIELLVRNHLPIIENINHLIKIFELTDKQEVLFFYPKNRSKLYKIYKIPKRNGGERIIESPCKVLKQIQVAINKVILNRFNMSNSACAYIKNKSIVDNAKPHVGAKIIWKFDIKDFFNTITLKQVVGQFRFFGYGKNVSRYLGYLCTNDKYVLPQGAPTSPTLSNLVCIKLDARIRGYASTKNLNYTRYADDITLSSNDEINNITVNKIKYVIMEIIKEEGFVPNYDKCKIYKKGSRLQITGIVINDKLSVKKCQIREVENAIRYIRKYGIENHINYLIKNSLFFVDNDDNDVVNKYLNHLFGLCYYICMVDKQNGEKLLTKVKTLKLGDNLDGN